MTRERVGDEDSMLNFASLCRLVADTSPVPTVGLELVTHLVAYVNPAFCHLTSSPESALIGRFFPDISPAGEDWPHLLDRVERKGKGEAFSGLEGSASTPTYWSYTVWPVLPEEMDRPLGILVQITEENPQYADAVAANEALTIGLIRQQELTEAAELLNAQLQAEIILRKKAEGALIVSEKLASAARMSAVIAHEINNPLAAVTDLLYLVQSVKEVPEEALHYLRTADGELKRMAHITRQTLGFYREMTAPTSFRIVSLLDSVLDLLQSKIKSKGAFVEKQYDSLLEVTAVYGELRQVFSNLVVNSLDAMEERGKMTLRAAISQDPHTRARRIRVIIADNGRGIDAETLPHIFEPFFTTKGLIGNGLGLWVSKQIVDHHGGAFQVRSSTYGSHRGTTFSVLLPSG